MCGLGKGRGEGSCDHVGLRSSSQFLESKHVASQNLDRIMGTSARPRSAVCLV